MTENGDKLYPPVVVHAALIERLKGLGPRFIKVARKGKNPVEVAWNRPENLMSADDPRLQTWLAEGGNYGVAGGYGLVILDADTDEIKERIKTKLPPTFTVESPGSKGWHCYFLCGLEKPIRLRDKEGENVGDIQGHGKMVVGPGSIHPNGERYRILNDASLAQVTKEQLIEALGEYVIPEREVQVIEELARKEKQQSNIDLNILQVVPLSKLKQRGDEYFGVHPIHGSKTGHNFWVNPSKNVWHCFRHGRGGGPLLWLAVEKGMIRCEEAGSGALHGDLFKKVLQKAEEQGLIPKVGGPSSDTTGLESKKRESHASKLVKLLLDERPLLFHDERKTPYVRFQNSPRQTLRLRTMEFRAMLAGLLWKAERKAPGSEALSAALNVLHHLTWEGQMIPLYNRLAWHEDDIWLDLTNDDWRAVKITKLGWAIEGEPPSLFRRYAQQLPITEPIHGGDPWKLLSCLNTREEDRLLFMVYVATLFIPDIPHAVLMLHGPQGSAKSTLMTLLKDLLDPSAIGVSALPKDERELIQALDHTYLAYFDNVGSLPDWVSDALCRATTGTGFSKRQLYTDDDDIIYRLQRPVGINSINVAAQRPDLLDRSLLIGLEQIPETKRRTMTDVRAEFSREQPSILGGFLDVVVKALNMPEPKLDRTYRMADFVSWGYRMAEALGRSGEEFIEAYGENVRQQAEEAVRADVLAEALLAYLEACKDKKWKGTATTLLNDLKAEAESLHISTRQRAWPKASYALTRRLKLLKDPLTRIGYIVEFTREGKERTRNIYLEKAGNLSEIVSGASAASASPSGRQQEDAWADETDATDTTFGTFPGISQQLRYLLPKRFMESDFVEHAVKLGLSEDETNKLFWKLVEEGRILRDPEGYWQWL